MTSFTLDLLDYTPITGALLLEEAPPPVQFYRQPHDLEMLNYNLGDSGRKYMGDGYRAGKVRSNAVDNGKTIPAVFRLLPSHSTKLSADWLAFWRALNWEFKDDILDTLIADNFAWTNNTADIPAFDQPRVCGGAILTGSPADGYLMIDSLLTSQPVPSATDVLACPWLWYYGTEVNPKGVPTYITRTARDGMKKPVRVPILSRLPLYAPVAWMHKLPLGWVPPNALWMA
jgi:hypothetical protein